MAGRGWRNGSWHFGLAAIALVFLIFGRSFLVPLVIAVLIFSLMSATIDRVSRMRIGAIGIPYWLASSIGLIAVGVAMFTIYSILSSELQRMIVALPRYGMKAEKLIASLSDWLGQDIAEAIRLAYGDMSLLSSLRAVASPAGYIVSTIVLIILYVAFLFVERSHMPQKFALLFPDANRSERVWGFSP